MQLLHLLEQKIFQMLLHGKKQREISEDLNVGIATVTRGSYAFENEEIFKIKSKSWS